MRVLVFSLITAGGFLMMSADTRGVDLPSAQWCLTGQLVPVGEFEVRAQQRALLNAADEHEKLKGVFDDDYPDPPPKENEEVESRGGGGQKMVGVFDDDYPDPPPKKDEELESRRAGALKMVGVFDDDYPDPPPKKDEEVESRGAAALKMVGVFDDDYPDPPPKENEEVESMPVVLAKASASEHCSRYTLAGEGDRGQVVAVLEWPQSLVDSKRGGEYRLEQGMGGVCVRCE